MIKNIPENRILLESDLEVPSDVNDELVNALELIAEVKDWTLEQASEITCINALEFYDFTDEKVAGAGDA